MKVMSLFDGISCGHIALDRAGIKVEKYYASEIKPSAIKVTMEHYPDTIQLGDVTKIDFLKYRGQIDLLIGGSPCQDLCSIGKREGITGSQSVLFFSFVKALKDIRPTYFLLENNASMKNKDKDIITTLLGVEPKLVNSSLLSAQNRRRLYWTNIDFETPQDKNIKLQDILEFGTTERSKSKTVRVGGAGSKWGNKHEWDMPNPERRYTTIELERLQTIPDNYTQGIKETIRRDLIGNGWTVDVIAHIFGFLPKED